MNWKDLKDDELLGEIDELVATAENELDDGKRTTLLLTAGIVRDELHRRQEGRRTATIRTLTWVIALLTLLMALASLGVLDYLKKTIGALMGIR